MFGSLATPRFIKIITIGRFEAVVIQLLDLFLKFELNRYGSARVDLLPLPVTHFSIFFSSLSTFNSPFYSAHGDKVLKVYNPRVVQAICHNPLILVVEPHTR